MIPVLFSYSYKCPVFAHKRLLKQFLPSIFKLEGKTLGQLHYVFGSDEQLLRINLDFLQHDSYTDIITFDLTEASSGIIGEIYISSERVAENAREYGTVFQTEMLRVIFHGALHLCGYKDKSKREIATMRNKEQEYLRLFGEFTLQSAS